MKDITERLAKVGERVRIPCPDGIKGCAVFHFRVETDPVCAEAIRDIMDLRRENIRLRQALLDVAAIDYRGNAHPSYHIARAALGEGKE
jgi:hypothetical protein